MSHDRFARWIKASFGLAKADKWLDANRNLGSNAELVYQLQGLGRFDVELQVETEIAAECIKLQQAGTTTISNAALVLPDRHRYQSFLWVLAAYELIRTLDQACSENQAIYGPNLSKDIKDFKHEIERLRVPLAKLESSRRNPGDFPRAYPVWINDQHVAWQVDSSTTITRQDLSDKLLLLVEGLRAVTFTTA